MVIGVSNTLRPVIDRRPQSDAANPVIIFSASTPLCFIPFPFACPHGMTSGFQLISLRQRAQIAPRQPLRRKFDAQYALAPAASQSIGSRNPARGANKILADIDHGMTNEEFPAPETERVADQLQQYQRDWETVLFIFYGLINF